MIPAVLREERQFRLLFLGQTLSVIGDRITSVVLPFAVLSIGGSTTDVGLVAAAGFLPFIVLGLVGGVIADRLRGGAHHDLFRPRAGRAARAAAHHDPLRRRAARDAADRRRAAGHGRGPGVAPRRADRDLRRGGLVL